MVLFIHFIILFLRMPGLLDLYLFYVYYYFFSSNFVFSYLRKLFTKTITS